jgi:hypothetical protein
MNAVVRAVVAVARFLYHFVVGDDPLAAAVMLLALGATAILVAARINAWWLVPAAAVAMTWVSLRRRAAS